MRWIYKDTPHEAEHLARSLGLHPLVARLLSARGHGEPSQAQRFLAPSFADLPDPFLMKGMNAAVARLQRALVQGERITVYGDYDVDGVTATASLVEFFRAAGGQADYYVPHRLREGYGLNPAAVRILAARGTRVVVTADCGINAVGEVQAATEAGLDVVVVDHHRAPVELPKAAAILNPHQPGCSFPGKELCAAGVAFFLLMALRRRLREAGWFGPTRPEPNLRRWLDLTAVGTVADVVPLTGPNRVLVREGLVELSRGTRPGLAALMRVSGVEPGGRVTASQVGFRLAPRINAAGRLDDAARGVELLLSRDEARCAALAAELEEANAERRRIEQEILAEAIAQAEAATARQEAHALVLSGEGWHPGVVGIVAGRVAERFGRPAVVIGLEGGEGKGSARSGGVERAHLHEMLSACAPHLTRFGGHKHAAGLSLAERALPAFRVAFESVAACALAGEPLGPTLRVDAQVRAEDLGLSLAEELSALAPFGAGNPEPVFVARRLRARSARVVGGGEGGQGAHVQLQIAAGPWVVSAIGFGMGARVEELAGRPFDAAFTLSLDEWRGERRARLVLKDVRDA